MATSKNPYAICDVCGFRFKHNQLRKNSYGMLVCTDDWEGSYDSKNHWQNKPPNVKDSEFVKDPRPPQSLGRNINWEADQKNWEDELNYWNTV